MSVSKPSLAKEWHPTKNVEIGPYEVTPCSGKDENGAIYSFGLGVQFT
jgi:hypothetical protein